MFELHVEPAPAGLAQLGGVVELREQDSSAVEDAFATAGGAGKAIDHVVAITLHVDGVPIGLEAWAKLPGRFLVAKIEARKAVGRMYGWTGPDDEAGDATPKG